MGSNGVRNLDDNQGVDLPIDNDDDGVEYIVRIWTIIAQGRLMTMSMMARILGDIQVLQPANTVGWGS